MDIGRHFPSLLPRTPTTLPTFTPQPSVTHQPTFPPTSSSQPTGKRLGSTAAIVDLAQLKMESISIALSIGVAGLLFAAFVFRRDFNIAERWKVLVSRRKEHVDEIKELLRSNGKSNSEIDEIIEGEFPEPRVPEHTVFNAAWRICFRVIDKTFEYLWIFFFELRLEEDPSTARKIDLDSSDFKRKSVSRLDFPSSLGTGQMTKTVPGRMRKSLEKSRLSVAGDILLEDRYGNRSRSSTSSPSRSRRLPRGRWSDISEFAQFEAESPHGAAHLLIDGFPPDCGPDKDNLYLSRAKALFERLKHVPHKTYQLSGGIFDTAMDSISFMTRFPPQKEGRYVSNIPLTEDLGQHSLSMPCELWFPQCKQNINALMRNALCGLARCRSGANPLLKYPVGVRLYFNLLKSLYRFFFWFSFVYIFIMGIFFYGSAWDNSQKLSFIYGAEARHLSEAQVSVVDRLKYVSLFLSVGSLGDRKHLCASGVEGGNIELSCPYGRIASVSAFYGYPQGSCYCPIHQLPENDDVCARDFGILSKTLFGERCCSEGKSAQGDSVNPSLYNHIPHAMPGCNSDTAQYIVENVCLGKRRCVLDVSSNYSYKYYPRVFNGRTLACTGFDNVTSRSHQCAVELGSIGQWGKCPKSSRRLAAYVECTNEDSLRIPFRKLGWWFNDLRTSKSEIVHWATLLDSVTMVFFLILLLWIESKENDEVLLANLETCTSSDYTLYLPHLPEHDDTNSLKRELAKFLESELSQAKPVTRVGPIEVCDINFGLNNGDQLRAFQKRGSLARKLDILEEKIYLMNIQQDVKRCFHSQRLLVLDEEVRLLRVQFKDACQDARYRKERIIAKSCFVTFMDQEGKERCLQMFGRIPWFDIYHRLCRVKSHRFQKSEGSSNIGQRLVFIPASEPEDIIWENLTTHTGITMCKKILTNLVIFTLMLASFAFVLKLNSMTSPETANTESNRIMCSSFRYFFNTTGFAQEIVGGTTLDTQLRVIDAQDVMKDTFPRAFNSTTGRLGLLGCYCEAISRTSDGFQKRDSLTMIDPYTGASKHYCKTFQRKQATAQSVSTLATILASFIVTAVNMGLNALYCSLIDFEGPKSRTGKELSLTRKLALAMFVNTGCLTVIVHGNPLWFNNVDSRTQTKVFDGAFNDFDVGWYQSVGSSLVLTMLFNAILMNIYKYVEWAQSYLMITLDQTTCSIRDMWGPQGKYISSKTTQAELEELYAGPLFVIYDRYASLINTLFVSIIFCGGIPVLVPILFVTLFITYCVDKHTLLRVYRLPAALDHTVAVGTTKYLQYAVMMHLFLAIWMYSNPNIFEGLDSMPLLENYITSMQVYNTTGDEYENYPNFKAESPWNLVKSRLYSMKKNIRNYIICGFVSLCLIFLLYMRPVLLKFVPCLSYLDCGANGNVKWDIVHDEDPDIAAPLPTRKWWTTMSANQAVDRLGWRKDIDESQCPHSMLRHHPAYGHSGERIGEGNPDFFHAISLSEIESILTSKRVSVQMLRAFKNEVGWRRLNPARARAKRTMIGLWSYDYQMNQEYRRSYALDSKSYYRFKSGKLNVVDADYLLRRRGLLSRFVGYVLSMGGSSRNDPTSVFPDPPAPDEQYPRVAVIGVPPRGIFGPRVVINVRVKGASVHASTFHGDDELDLEELNGPFQQLIDVPGVGELMLKLPSGLRRQGVPEIQLEIPCVEIIDGKRGDGVLNKCDSIRRFCNNSRWDIEMAAIDYEEVQSARSKVYSEAVKRAHDSPIVAPQQEFSRCEIDDLIDHEMRREEIGKPLLQQFKAVAPKTVVLRNMIEVIVTGSSKLYCLWPSDAKEGSELLFRLPAVASSQFPEGFRNGFFDPRPESEGGKYYNVEYSDDRHMETLFSPGWGLIQFPENDVTEENITKCPIVGNCSTKYADDFVIATFHQVVTHAAKPILKDFQNIRQTDFKLPGERSSMVVFLPPKHSEVRGRSIRVRVPVCRNQPLHRQQQRVSIIGLAEEIPVEILASDIVTVPGLHGKPIQAFGFLPWEDWWVEDPLVTQQMVPQVDEIFFEYPCIRLTPSNAPGREESTSGTVFEDTKLCEDVKNVFFSHDDSDIIRARILEKTSSKRDKFRVESSEWAVKSEQVFQDRLPLHRQKFQIVADQAAELAATSGNFVRVSIPTLQNIIAFFPPDSKAGETQLFFELPALNVDEDDSAPVVDEGQSFTLAAGLRAQNAGRSFCLKSRSSDRSKSCELNRPSSYEPILNSSKEDSDGGLRRALRLLKQHHDESKQAETDALDTEDNCCSSAHCSVNDLMSVVHPLEEFEDDETKSNFLPQQIGWVVVPIGVESDVKVYAMLPAMVEYDQVLRAVTRASGFMNPHHDVPPNPLCNQVSVKVDETKHIAIPPHVRDDVVDRDYYDNPNNMNCLDHNKSDEVLEPARSNQMGFVCTLTVPRKSSCLGLFLTNDHDSGSLLVSSVAYQSLADKSGFRVGDRIIEVDGNTDISTMAHDPAARLLDYLLTGNRRAQVLVPKGGLPGNIIAVRVPVNFDQPCHGLQPTEVHHIKIPRNANVGDKLEFCIVGKKTDHTSDMHVVIERNECILPCDTSRSNPLLENEFIDVESADAQTFIASLQGTSKIGLELTSCKYGQKCSLVVERVHAAGAAFRSGLQHGDKLLRINGVDCSEWSSRTASRRLVRALRSKVTIVIEAEHEHNSRLPNPWKTSSWIQDLYKVKTGHPHLSPVPKTSIAEIDIGAAMLRNPLIPQLSSGISLSIVSGNNLADSCHLLRLETSGTPIGELVGLTGSILVWKADLEANAMWRGHLSRMWDRPMFFSLDTLHDVIASIRIDDNGERTVYGREFSLVFASKGAASRVEVRSMRQIDESAIEKLTRHVERYMAKHSEGTHASCMRPDLSLLTKKWWGRLQERTVLRFKCQDAEECHQMVRGFSLLMRNFVAQSEMGSSQSASTRVLYRNVSAAECGADESPVAGDDFFYPSSSASSSSPSSSSTDDSSALDSDFDDRDDEVGSRMEAAQALSPLHALMGPLFRSTPTSSTSSEYALMREVAGGDGEAAQYRRRRRRRRSQRQFEWKDSPAPPSHLGQRFEEGLEEARRQQKASVAAASEADTLSAAFKKAIEAHRSLVARSSYALAAIDGSDDGSDGHHGDDGDGGDELSPGSKAVELTALFRRLFDPLPTLPATETATPSTTLSTTSKMAAAAMAGPMAGPERISCHPQPTAPLLTGAEPHRTAASRLLPSPAARAPATSAAKSLAPMSAVTPQSARKLEARSKLLSRRFQSPTSPVRAGSATTAPAAPAPAAPAPVSPFATSSSFVSPSRPAASARSPAPTVETALSDVSNLSGAAHPRPHTRAETPSKPAATAAASSSVGSGRFRSPERTRHRTEAAPIGAAAPIVAAQPTSAADHRPSLAAKGTTSAQPPRGVSPGPARPTAPTAAQPLAAERSPRAKSPAKTPSSAAWKR